MKSKQLILITILAICGQLIYMAWPSSGAAFMITRALIITLAVKAIGDLLGRFVLNIPNYNWVYLRDYLRNEIITQLSFLIIFAVLWVVPSIFMEFWGYSKSLLGIIWNGGLVPTLFYILLQRGAFEQKDSVKRRMKRKL